MSCDTRLKFILGENRYDFCGTKIHLCHLKVPRQNNWENFFKSKGTRRSSLVIPWARDKYKCTFTTCGYVSTCCVYQIARLLEVDPLMKEEAIAKELQKGLDEDIRSDADKMIKEREADMKNQDIENFFRNSTATSSYQSFFASPGCDEMIHSRYHRVFLENFAILVDDPIEGNIGSEHIISILKSRHQTGDLSKRSLEGVFVSDGNYEPLMTLFTGGKYTPEIIRAHWFDTEKNDFVSATFLDFLSPIRSLSRLVNEVVNGKRQFLICPICAEMPSYDHWMFIVFRRVGNDFQMLIGDGTNGNQFCKKDRVTEFWNLKEKKLITTRWFYRYVTRSLHEKIQKRKEQEIMKEWRNDVFVKHFRLKWKERNGRNGWNISYFWKVLFENV